MRTPTVDIVIVNWNSGGQLRACLDSVSAARPAGYHLRRVVVVDNASSDGSAEGLQAKQIALTVLQNRDNHGFAAAANQGADGSCSDYLLFLNPDALVYADTIAESVRFMEAAENRGVGISSVSLIDDTGEISRCCARFPTATTFIAKMLALHRLRPRRYSDLFYSEWDHRTTRCVDHVMGAYYFIRTDLFKSHGGFDERFFVYFEDLDLSLRVTHAKWVVCYVASTQAYHTGGGTSRQVRAQRLFYSLRSRLLYGAKHFTPASAALLFAATLLLEPMSRIGFLICRGSFTEVFETVRAYGLLFADLPWILRTALTSSTLAEPQHRRFACLSDSYLAVPTTTSDHGGSERSHRGGQC